LTLFELAHTVCIIIVRFLDEDKEEEAAPKKKHHGEFRAGTVDKFQGQEAEVVIISMTTSSGEYLPRYIEFLYSKNRLNVAISRARTLAILVVNPSLLTIKCNTIEQIELVNTLCWARHYAEQGHHITSMGVW